MSFINERFAIIRRSYKDMFYISPDSDGLYYNYYDDNGYTTEHSNHRLFEEWKHYDD